MDSRNSSSRHDGLRQGATSAHPQLTQTYAVEVPYIDAATEVALGKRTFARLRRDWDEFQRMEDNLLTSIEAADTQSRAKVLIFLSVERALLETEATKQIATILSIKARAATALPVQ